MNGLSEWYHNQNLCMFRGQLHTSKPQQSQQQQTHSNILESCGSHKWLEQICGEKFTVWSWVHVSGLPLLCLPIGSTCKTHLKPLEPCWFPSSVKQHPGPMETPGTVPETTGCSDVVMEEWKNCSEGLCFQCADCHFDWSANLEDHVCIYLPSCSV